MEDHDEAVSVLNAYHANHEMHRGYFCIVVCGVPSVQYRIRVVRHRLSD